MFPLVTLRCFKTDEKSDAGHENFQFDFGNVIAPIAFPNSILDMRCHPSLFPIRFRLCHATFRFSQSDFAYAMPPFAVPHTVNCNHSFDKRTDGESMPYLLVRSLPRLAA